MTHDLCKSMIVQLGATLRRVQITRVENSTYYGELHLERGGAIVHVDSRPSDAIAIAIRLDAPIFAAESLLVLNRATRKTSRGREEISSAAAPRARMPRS